MKVEIQKAGETKFSDYVDYNLQPVEITNNIHQIKVTFDMNKNVSSLFVNYSLSPSVLTAIFTIIKFKDIMIDILKSN